MTLNEALKKKGLPVVWSMDNIKVSSLAKHWQIGVYIGL